MADVVACSFHTALQSAAGTTGITILGSVAVDNAHTFSQTSHLNEENFVSVLKLS